MSFCLYCQDAAYLVITDGEKLGGCETGTTNCSNSSNVCNQDSGSDLFGTCVYSTGQVPDSFGDGVCRTGM